MPKSAYVPADQETGPEQRPMAEVTAAPPFRAAVRVTARQDAWLVRSDVPMALVSWLRALSEDLDLVICPHPDAALPAVGKAHDHAPKVNDEPVALILEADLVPPHYANDTEDYPNLLASNAAEQC